MIVIYTLMTSIIFGSRSKNKVMGQMQYTCPRCGRPAFHALGQRIVVLEYAGGSANPARENTRIPLGGQRD